MYCKTSEGNKMLVGGAVARIWFFAGNPFGISAFWPAMVVTFAVFIPLSLVSHRTVSEEYLRYSDIYQTTLESEGRKWLDMEKEVDFIA